VILMRAAVLSNKVSNFSDGLVKYNFPCRGRESSRGGKQVQRHPGTGCVRGQVHVVTTLLLGKHLRYPLNRKPGGPQSRSGKSGKFVNF
jgi:hypothetical protein